MGKTTSSKTPRSLFTAGYEGQAPEAFLVKLRKAGVRRLIEVRKNAISRKRGFSKKALAQNCAAAHVEYVHLPELGVPSSMRHGLKSRDDYRKLMTTYRRSILPKARESRQEAARLVTERTSALPPCMPRNCPVP